MQIFVKTLKNESLCLKVSPKIFIKDIKRMIEAREGIKCNKQRLRYSGK